MKLISRRSRIIVLILTYGFLLCLSYGFPVTGDDWYFTVRDTSDLSLLDPFRGAFRVACEHYQTTNGRLLGNFIVMFTGYSRIFRELVRCGIILAVIWQSWRLSKLESLLSWLVLTALCISLPAVVVGETYAWAAGFFNYVPPALFCLLYFRLLVRIFRGEKRTSGIGWLIGAFILGICTQLFTENVTVSMVPLCLFMNVFYAVRRKRLSPMLIVHFVGIVLGAVLMFLSPGYRQIGEENYRSFASSFSELYPVLQENTRLLSWYLFEENKLVVIPLSVAGIMLWSRRLRAESSPASGEKRLGVLCVLVLASFPLAMSFLLNVGNYRYYLDLLVVAAWLFALCATAVRCLPEEWDRFTVCLLVLVFPLIISPLLVVSPVGARNTYLYQILLITVLGVFLRNAISGMKDLRLWKLAAVAAASLLLLSSMWIFWRNGNCERLRNRIVDEAMAKGETTITLPSYPYPQYVHSPGAKAISFYYYYETRGDIRFYLVTYKEWVSTHPDD